MSPRTQRCDERTITGRLRKAEQFFDAAETIRELADDEQELADSHRPVLANDRKRAHRAAEKLVRAARDLRASQ